MELAAAIETLLDHLELFVQEPDVVRSPLVVYRQRAGVGFSDCLVLEIARAAGHLSLGTFDRRLGRVEGTRRL